MNKINNDTKQKVKNKAATQKTILILGANSDVAKEIAILYAKDNYELYLGCLKTSFSKVGSFGDTLNKKYKTKITLIDFDATATNTHLGLFKTLECKPQGVIYCAGYLPDENKARDDYNETKKSIDINFVGAISILNIFASYYKKQKRGFIVAISSVAGDRGRGSNYIYGCAKAGLSVYLSGLRNYLFKDNVDVIEIRPGFIQSKMIKHLKTPKILTASPQEVAKITYQSIKKRKNIVYVKSIFTCIMLIIRIIPEPIFKRLSL